MRFAVIDVETTGLGRADRLVEAAVVVLDEALSPIDEFDTLINPLRDVGPTAIHGVTASMVTTAPSFADIAGALAARIDGAVLVAHNLPFDLRMLAQEFDRVGCAINGGLGFDTLRFTGCGLEAACNSFGIPLTQHHRALADARATAQLLRVLFEDGEPVVTATIQNPPPEETVWTLRREAVQAEITGLVRLRPPLRYPTGDAAMLAYLHALNWVLDDAVIDTTERTELDLLASDLGLDPTDTTRMHTHYFRQLVTAATRDGIVTAEEHGLLEKVARALGIDAAFIPEITQEPSITPLAKGIRICFTGEDASRSRTELEILAARAGFQPVSAVTKKGCDLVVAADPATQSGKARKAHQYGIPILGVSDFLSSLEVGEAPRLGNA